MSSNLTFGTTLELDSAGLGGRHRSTLGRENDRESFRVADDRRASGPAGDVARSRTARSRLPGPDPRPHVPLELVSDALGHSTIAITADTYADLSREQWREAANAIERAIGDGA